LAPKVCLVKMARQVLKENLVLLVNLE
jgi:hypothetical protein